MIELASKDYSYMKICDIELKKDPNVKSYTYDTLKELNEIYDHEFYFIIGADSLFSIEKWVHPEKLLRTCILLAAYRNGKGTQEMLSQIHYLARKYECDIRLMNTPDVEISSSDIRKRIKEGLPISEFVPEAVEKYIAEKHLFEEEQNGAVDNT